MARPVENNYTLILSVDPKGGMYCSATIINKRKGIAKIVDTCKHCLQSIQEKVALLKLVRYDYDTRPIGAWLGEGHVSVTLTADEFKFLLKGAEDVDTRRESEGSSQEDSRQIPLPL